MFVVHVQVGGLVHCNGFFMQYIFICHYQTQEDEPDNQEQVAMKWCVGVHVHNYS